MIFSPVKHKYILTQQVALLNTYVLLKILGFPSLMAQMVMNLPVMWETGVRSLGQEDALEKEMATHSSIVA